MSFGNIRSLPQIDRNDVTKYEEVILNKKTACSKGIQI